MRSGPRRITVEEAVSRSKDVLRQVPGVGVLQAGRTYVRGMTSSTKHNPCFVVFCRGRDGSTLLVDLLNQLPGVHCDGEILHDPVLAPRLYVQGRQSLAPGQAYGFKLLSSQLTHIQRVTDAGAFLRHLDRSGYRIIYLKRWNRLRVVLSNFYARHRGGYHHNSADGTPEMTRMTVDVDELHYWLREDEHRGRNEEAALSGLRLLDLVYERDLQRADAHQNTVDRVAEYLGVQSAPVNPGLARLTSDDLAEFVSNHDEVVRFVEGTEYKRYLRAF
jgi:LPS sulfotransferase NodH